MRRCIDLAERARYCVWSHTRVESDCYLLQAVAHFNHQDCVAIWSGCVDHFHCRSYSPKAEAEKVQSSQQHRFGRKLAKLMLLSDGVLLKGTQQCLEL